jgi:hypothetical protein
MRPVTEPAPATPALVDVVVELEALAAALVLFTSFLSNPHSAPASISSGSIPSSASTWPLPRAVWMAAFRAGPASWKP